jgi:hypothetical protein
MSPAAPKRDSYLVKSVVHCSELLAAFESGGSYVLPRYEPDYKRLDYGPSDFDHRNVFSLSYVWAFPKINKGNGVLRYILNDWQANGIIQARSGNPLTLTSSSNNGSLTAQTRDRAVFLGGNPYGSGACISAPCKDFLNPNVFAASVSPTPTNPNPANR